MPESLTFPRGVARIRMRTEAGKMPESLTFPIKNGLGVSNDRFGFKPDESHRFQNEIPERNFASMDARLLPGIANPSKGCASK